MNAREAICTAFVNAFRGYTTLLNVYSASDPTEGQSLPKVLIDCEDCESRGTLRACTVVAKFIWERKYDGETGTGTAETIRSEVATVLDRVRDKPNFYDACNTILNPIGLLLFHFNLDTESQQAGGEQDRKYEVECRLTCNLRQPTAGASLI